MAGERLAPAAEALLPELGQGGQQLRPGEQESQEDDGHHGLPLAPVVAEETVGART